MALTAYFQSTSTLKAALTDSAGAAVNAATVTVTIKDRKGTALATDQAMTEDGTTGVYEYTIADDLLPNAGARYVAEITAVKGSDTRYAEANIENQVDRT